MVSKLFPIFVMFLFVAAGVAQTIDVTQLIQLYNANVDQVPDYVKSVIGDENLHIYFTWNGGVTSEFAAITKNALITEASAWTDNNGNGNHDNWEGRNIQATMKLTANEGTLRRIAGSPDPVAAFRAAWGNEIKFESLNIVNGLKLGVVNIGMWFFGLFAPAPPQPTIGKAGDLCQHGGECETGNCLGVGQGPPWTYRCSCDPFSYVVENPCRPTMPEQTTGKRVGETCNHGGECETGNCIGVIPGQLYKCSCDPFRYDETSC